MITRFLERKLDRYFAKKIAEREGHLLEINLLAYAKTDWRVDALGRPYIAVLIQKDEGYPWRAASSVYPEEALMVLAAWSVEAEEEFIEGRCEWWRRINGSDYIAK